MLDSRSELTAVLREYFAYDISPKESADEIVTQLRKDGWRLVDINALATAIRLLAIDEQDFDRVARQLLAVVDDIQGELEVADYEVVLDALDEAMDFKGSNE